MLTVHGLLIYCGIYALAIATPGPGIMAIIARSLNGDVRATIPAILGHTVGDLTLMSLSVFGLAVIARELGWLFLAVKLSGGAYLIYLGYRYWTAKIEAIVSMPPEQLRGIWSQLALTLSNPKAIAMFIALLPAAVDLNRLNIVGYFQLCLCTLVLIPGIDLVYAALAAQARKFLQSTAARKRMNKSAGAIMMGAGVGVVVS